MLVANHSLARQVKIRSSKRYFVRSIAVANA
jgi:hypothetical protein